MWSYIVVNFLSMILVSWIVVKIAKRNFYTQMQWILLKTPIDVSNKSVLNYFNELFQTSKAFIAIGKESAEIIEQIQKIDTRYPCFYFEDMKSAFSIDFEKLPNDIAIVVGNIDQTKQKSILHLIEKAKEQEKRVFCYVILFPQTDDAIHEIEKISVLLRKDTDTLILLQNKNDLIGGIVKDGSMDRRLSVNFFEIPFTIYLDMMVFALIKEKRC